jgi:hypothetical protein
MHKIAILEEGDGFNKVSFSNTIIIMNVIKQNSKKTAKIHFTIAFEHGTDACHTGHPQLTRLENEWYASFD